jgi:CheY-like chemotaxis protein
MKATHPEIQLLIGAKPGEKAEALRDILEKGGVKKIHWVQRGPEVIEKVLEQNFTGILLDYSLTLISPLELREILRHNPRTTSIPILLMDLYDLSPRTPENLLYIRSPLEHPEWLSLILPGFEHQEEILKVSLRDLPLLDLIQILLQGQRSGILEIQHLTEFGRIEILPPALGEISWNGKFFGVKALSRCLRLTEGSALFRRRSGLTPRYPDPGKVLLEAVKDRDEYTRYRPLFPPNSFVSLERKADSSPIPDDFYEELLMILEVEPRVDLILDQLPRPDGEILSLLYTLKEKGWITSASRKEELPLSEFGTQPPSLPVPPGMYLTFWILGEEGAVTDALFRDPRLARLLNFQATLSNPGRFGGNHWVLRFPGEIQIWLRFLPPSLAHPDWMTRRGWINAGIILLLSDQEEEVSAFEKAVHLLQNEPLPLVWVLWTGREKERLWSEIFGEELYGRVIQSSDPVEGFLKALHFLLYEQTLPQ